MRGGKREGAGRKKKEPTVVMRVPESLVDAVNSLIQLHREKSSKEVAKKACNEKSNENQSTRSKKSKSIKNIAVTVITEKQRRDFNRLPASVKNKIKRDYGTASAAFSRGMIIEGKRAKLPTRQEG